LRLKCLPSGGRRVSNLHGQSPDDQNDTATKIIVTTAPPTPDLLADEPTPETPKKNTRRTIGIIAAVGLGAAAVTPASSSP
jgi:hypothetical protein